MKKCFLKALSALFIVFSVAGMVSCGDDGDGDGGGGSSGGGSSKVPAPYLTDADGNKLQVLSVNQGSSLYATYAYDEKGKLTRIKYYEYDFDLSGSDFTLSYSDKYENIVMKIKTNNKGLITSIESTEKYLGSSSGSGSVNGTETYTCTYKYNENNQLTNASLVGTEGDGDKISASVVCTWSNGNLVTLVYEDKETDIETGEIDEGKKTYTFTYGNQINTFKQLPECIWDRICHDGPEFFCALGLFGVGPANLPTGYTRVSSSGSSSSYSLSYTLNADGSIETESEKASGSSYSNSTISYTYK